MTPDELDALAVVQAEIRSIFEAARTSIMGWEPGPYVPAWPDGAGCPPPGEPGRDTR